MAGNERLERLGRLKAAVDAANGAAFDSERLRLLAVDRIQVALAALEEAIKADQPPAPVEPDPPPPPPPVDPGKDPPVEGQPDFSSLTLEFSSAVVRWAQAVEAHISAPV
jgi:hypothetical protein